MSCLRATSVASDALTSRTVELPSPKLAAGPSRQCMVDSPVSPASPRPDLFCAHGWTAVRQSAPVLALQGAFECVPAKLGAAAAWCGPPMPIAMAFIGVTIGAIGISGAVVALVKLGMGAAAVLIPSAVLSAVAASMFIGAALVWHRRDAASEAVPTSASSHPSESVSGAAADTLLADKINALKTPEQVERFEYGDVPESEMLQWGADAQRLASSPSPDKNLLAVSILESMAFTLRSQQVGSLRQESMELAHRLALPRVPHANGRLAGIDGGTSQDSRTLSEVGERAVGVYAMLAPGCNTPDAEDQIRSEITKELASMDFANELNILSILLDIIAVYRSNDARACELSDAVDQIGYALNARSHLTCGSALNAAFGRVRKLVQEAKAAISVYE